MDPVQLKATSMPVRDDQAIRLTRLYHRAGIGRVVIVSLLATVAFMLYFRVSEKGSGESPGVIALEFAFTESNFQDIVDKWQAAGLLDVQRRNLWIDLLFPLAYATFLSSLLVWARHRPDEQPEPSSHLEPLLLLPFIAGVLDWTENGLLLVLLGDTAKFSAPLIAIASSVATAKWLLVLVAAVTAAWAVVQKFGSARRRAYRP